MTMGKTATKPPARKSKRPPRKPGPGRDTKLTPETQAAICRHLAMGMGRNRSARLSGIGTATFHRWMAEGDKEENGAFRDFRDSVEKAEDEFCAKLTNVVVVLAFEAESEGTRLAAATKMLERRFPDDWSARQEVRHSGPTGGAVQVEDVTVRVDPLTDRLAALDPEKLDALLSKVE